jgi:non-specific serine/threonine protein kinase
MEITHQTILRMATPATIHKGERYYLQGRVKLLKSSSDAVSAIVRGTRPYSVTLEKKGRSLQTSCTCPFTWGGECKHVVAVMYALLKRPQSLQTHDSPLLRELMRGSGGTASPRRRLPTWAKSVSRILDQPPPAHSSPLDWRLGFSLSLEGPARRLYPLRIRIRKDGTEGQASILQRFHPYDFDRLDRDQRILLSLLLQNGGHNSSEEGYDLYLGSNAFPDGNVRNAADREDLHWNDLLLLLHNQTIFLRENKNFAGRRLTIIPEAGHASFSLSEAAGELTLYPEIEWTGTTTPVSDDIAVISNHPLWVLLGDQIRRIEGITGDDLQQLQRMSTPLVVPARDREAFLNHALPQLLSRYRLRSSALEFRAVSVPPVPRLYLLESAGSLVAEIRFRYDSLEVLPGLLSPSGPDIFTSEGTIVTLQRDRDAEQAAISRLVDTGLQRDLSSETPLTFSPKGDPLEWLADNLPGLRDSGFEVFGQDQLRRYRVRSAPTRVSFSISSGIDWFDLTMDLSFEGTPVSLAAFLQAIREKKRFVRLADGSYGMLPQEWLRRFAMAAALGNPEEETLRFSRTQIPLLEELSETGEFDADITYEHLRQRLASFSGIEAHAGPEGFAGTLRPYQQAGIDWLLFLHDFGFGGLLADDMGLGKTIQTLALLQHIHALKKEPPSLIVVPTSLVHNWESEASHFTPSLRALVYHGIGRKQYRNKLESCDVVITSYGILRRDIEFLRGLTFTYVVLDESQNIKNFASVNARAVRHLKSHFRLALTGTPVENNLTELWSQFQFLNPGMLGGLRTFTESFARPIERLHDESRAATLRRMIHPFLLRRTKELVAAELPPKVESTVLCDMEEAQRSAYHHWREYYRQAIMRSVETVGLRRSTVKVLEGLTKLRLVCCHPQLADEQYHGSSGKYNAFQEMLDDILAEGHKVLVFSQFVKMLTILRRHLDKHNVVYEYLDGRTIHRKERVDHFQNDEAVKVFLISLRAGGTGLNLTSADYVIHYDPWWNPAVETQATDRTHRIGQLRQVFSYKLITRESVEEKILALQDRKKQLVGNIITTEESFLKSLTREDIQDLFG